MDGTGKVTVLIGSQSNGQGHETAYTQIVSARLGIPPRTSKSSRATATRISFGSRHRRVALHTGRRCGPVGHG